MAETIREAVVRIKDDPELAPLNALNEQQVKVGIIEPLLEIAGWDRKKIQTEFVPEYKIGNEEVDYALRIVSSNRVFVEAKNASVDLHGRPVEQLLNYCKSAESTDDAPDIGVLTNGRLWWLYARSTDKQGGWRSPRQFCTINIESDSPTEVQNNFKRFLFKDKYEDRNSAWISAGKEYGKLQRDTKTEKAIFEAWNRIVQTPEDGLMGLIASVTEDICGNNPAPKMIRDFLKKHMNNLVISEEPNIADPAPRDGREDRFDTKGKKTQKLHFKGDVYEVTSWAKALNRLCVLVYDDQNGKDFDKILEIKGTRNPYFSKHGEDLNKPERLDPTGLYVATGGIGGDTRISICDQVLKKFGYPKGAARIEGINTTTQYPFVVHLPKE